LRDGTEEHKAVRGFSDDEDRTMGFVEFVAASVEHVWNLPLGEFHAEHARLSGAAASVIQNGCG
jgi:hypothetical protein